MRRSPRWPSALYRFVERYLIWGSIAALSATVRGVSRGVAAAQTGLVRSYAVTLVAGASGARRLLPDQGQPVTTF